MRILQIITRSELRGAEVFAAQLSEQLALRGHEVCLAALYRAESPSLLTACQVERVEFQGRVKGRVELAPWFRQLRLFRRFQPDIVQANGFHALKYAALAKRFGWLRAPLVYRNISIASGWIRNGYRKRWGRWLAGGLSRVASVSEAARTDFVETYQLDPKCAFTIRRGISIPKDARRDEARDRICSLIGADGTAPLLFHIGGFTEEKNHLGLLESFAIVHRSFPDARLVLLGDGPLRNECEQRVRKWGLSGVVHSLGVRADARDLLSGADMLLLSSRIEGIPGVVLEAAARGVPTVCTDVGSVGEAIADGSSGILVPFGDKEAFANATCELLANENRRRRLGEVALCHVREHYAMIGAIDRFEELYESTLCDGGS